MEAYVDDGSSTADMIEMLFFFDMSEKKT